ncbi:MAG: diguanylate cyclase [Candidatus Eisenbacteria bacterium]|nr:diguanylate cyclase [Candidatus Eisenbacteria bacterium]
MDDSMIRIIGGCLQVELAAKRAYEEIASLTADADLVRFWLGMAADEEGHALYWRRLWSAAEQWELPPIFDDPESTRREIERILPEAEELLERFRATRDTGAAFLTAYRLEFLMLHPAFQALFQTLRPVTGEPGPIELYEDHINGFVKMLVRHAGGSAEGRLLAETLSSLWKRNRQLLSLATRDPLTGLFNRRAFSSLSTQLAYLAARNRSPVGVLMIDIDDFKEINDECGHAVGDAVLQGMATIILENLRASDVVARYGGEEFVVFLPETDPGAIAALAEKLRARIEESLPACRRVTVSIGGAVRVLDGNVGIDLPALIRRADENLYRAKQAGKNRAVVDS